MSTETGSSHPRAFALCTHVCSTPYCSIQQAGHISLMHAKQARRSTRAAYPHA